MPEFHPPFAIRRTHFSPLPPSPRSSGDDYGLLSKKTKNTFEVKSTHATATSTPVCTGADVCASMEVMCEGGAKRKYGLYS